MTHGRVRRAGFLSRQPGDDVALGVPTPEVLQNQVTATPAQSRVSWSENVSVGQVRPGTESACSANGHPPAARRARPRLAGLDGLGETGERIRSCVTRDR